MIVRIRGSYEKSFSFGDFFINVACMYCMCDDCRKICNF